jgi:hypothetical protein
MAETPGEVAVPDRSSGAWATGLALAALGPASRLALYARANADALASPRPVLVVALAAAVVGVAVAIAVARPRVRSPAAVGAVVGTIGHLGFGAAVFGDGVATRPLLWALACAVVGFGVADLARRRWSAICLVVLALATTAIGVVGAVADRSSVATTDEADVASVARRPDVWLLIADGLGRADQLDAVVGHDATGFGAELAQRGFQVDPSATVGYGETHWSMVSLLQQEYPAEDGPSSAVRPASARPVVQGDNRTVRHLTAAGYRYVHASPGLIDWLACHPGRADRCIEPDDDGRAVRWSEASRSLVDLTPLGPLVRATDGLAGGVADPVSVVDRVLDGRSDAGDGPMFVYAHLLSPHPPYRFDERCRLRAEPIGDVAVGWDDQHRAPYAAQTACLEQQLLEAVDRIRADDPEAIVVIAGDHGPAFGMDFGPLSMFTPELLAERFTAFRALALPEACRTDDPRASALVNVFRLVEACLRAEEPDLLPARAFVTFGPTVEEVDPALVASWTE